MQPPAGALELDHAHGPWRLALDPGRLAQLVQARTDGVGLRPGRGRHRRLSLAIAEAADPARTVRVVGNQRIPVQVVPGGRDVAQQQLADAAHQRVAIRAVQERIPIMSSMSLRAMRSNTWPASLSNTMSCGS